MAASSPSKTRAVPVNCIMAGLTAPCLTTAPSGASVPFSTAMPPSCRHRVLQRVDDVASPAGRGLDDLGDASGR